MTTNINEITLAEAEAEYYSDIEDMIDAEIEQEVSGYAEVIKERYAAYRRYVELALTGALCIVCLIRPMATDGLPGHGFGWCSHCGEMALEQTGGC